MGIYNSDQAKIFYGDISTSAFKSVIRKSTQFSFSQRKIHYKDNHKKTDLFGKSLLFDLHKHGDLIGNILVEVKVSGYSTSGTKYSVNHFGNALLKLVTFKIGMQTIDKHSNKWLQIETELYNNDNDTFHLLDTSDTTYGGIDSTVIAGKKIYRSKLSDYKKITGNCPLVFGSSDATTNSLGSNNTYSKHIYIPLKFFFNKNIGQFLPIRALNKNDVQIIIDLETKEKLQGSLDSLSIDDINLIVDYYHLSREENLRFSNNLSYIIETVQEMSDYTSDTKDNSISFFTGNTGGVLTEKNYNINQFSKNVKYLTWIVVDDNLNDAGTGPCYFKSLCDTSEYGDDGTYGDVHFKLDNQKHNNMGKHKMSYFTRYVPYKYCKKNIPILDRIGVYSFSIDPFNHGINGFCDFTLHSRKNLYLTLANNNINSITNKNIYIYAVNYNILNISNGTGCLKYQ